MAKKYNNLCQTQDRLSKKSLLAYLGIYDINDTSTFSIDFDENFNNPCVNKKSNKSVPSGKNNIQNLFYRICLKSWDINSYNSSTGEVCVVLYNPHGNTLISFNLNKNP